MGADESAQGRPDRRSKPTLVSEEEMEGESDVKALQEQLKKLRQENKALNEGFTNKVKSLENKVYDVTISALKAGFVNKFLLEHPLRENEKLQIIHRFSNAQTKEQIKETYISLTNEFAKGQTVKDGSMLNESVQNKLGKIHRTDNAIVTEKNLMNENDESNRFKQLLNYNFNKKK
jgi:predicted nuclease with TOPRIM domain